MIGSVSTNRRAHAFARALDVSEPPDETPEEQPQAAGSDPARDTGSPEPGEGSSPDQAEDGEHQMLLAVVEELDQLPKPRFDPEVKSAQRAQLVAAMEREFAGGQVPGQRGPSGRGAHRARPQNALDRLRPKSRLGKGLAAGGLTVGVAAGAFGGVAAASTDALPGDRLYGFKRGMEDFKIDMAGDDTARGKLHLDHASTRMHEARRLMERGRSGPLDESSLGQVRRALGSLSSNAAEGRRLLSDAYSERGDIAPLRSLSAFADSHREHWSALREQLPDQLLDVSEKVSSVFDAMREDVTPIKELTPSQPSPGATGGQSDDGTRPGAGPDEDAPASGRDGGDADGKGERSQDRDTSENPTDGTSPSQRDPSPDERDDGLLGGSGGLFDPVPGDGDSGSDPTPDITIPPLLPGGLPGLGLETGRDG